MVNECLGTDATKCQDCALKDRKVPRADAFILPPISEAGNCQFYVMGEDYIKPDGHNTLLSDVDGFNE